MKTYESKIINYGERGVTCVSVEENANDPRGPFVTLYIKGNKCPGLFLERADLWKLRDAINECIRDTEFKWKDFDSNFEYVIEGNVHELEEEQEVHCDCGCHETLPPMPIKEEVE